MVPLRCVIKLHKSTSSTAKFTMDSCITPRDRVSNHTCHHIKWDVINAKAPDKVFNVDDMFLMGFGCELSFEEPTAIRDLADMTDLGESGNAFSHDNSFVLAV